MTAYPQGHPANDLAVYLHAEDYLQTLRLLDALLGTRADKVDLGYRPDGAGAWVDWPLLGAGKLSSTEIAVVDIAQAAAVLEHHGGTAPRLRGVVVDVVSTVVGKNLAPSDRH